MQASKAQRQGSGTVLTAKKNEGSVHCITAFFPSNDPIFFSRLFKEEG